MKRQFEIAMQIAALGLRERNAGLLQNAAARLQEIAAHFDGKPPPEKIARDLNAATLFLNLIANHRGRIGLSESAGQLARDATGLSNTKQAFDRIGCGFAELVFERGERLDEVDEAQALIRKERRQRNFKKVAKR